MASARVKRLRAAINRLALVSVSKCRTQHSCCFCTQPIVYGDEYRNAGPNLRSHILCFEAVSRDLKG
jgi:hypothetical protein